MSSTTVSHFGDPSRIWSLPAEDLSRQATASLRGYVYQLHASAAAWLALGLNEELYLEVAEDYAELLRDPDTAQVVLRATQVKDTRDSGTVTLNSPDVLAAIEALYRLQVNNPGRETRLVFLTTSSIGKEKKDTLPSGVAGLHAWKEAASGGDVEEVRTALLQRPLSDGLRTLVASSSAQKLKEELLSRIVFACSAQDWVSLEESCRNAIVERRSSLQATAEMAHRAYDAVFREVMACALGPGPRRLDGRQLQACLERATSIPVPSGIAINFTGDHGAKNSTPLSNELLRNLAQSLLEAGRPPSIELLFPGAKTSVREALKNAFSAAPLITEVTSNGTAASASISELLARADRKHLIIGQPGSGKTHALWNAACELLASGSGVIPLYLPAGQAENWRELEETLRESMPRVDFPVLFQDSRICVFIDGWSEFSDTAQVTEKRRALRALHSTRVIATAKFADVDDGGLKQWTLDLLSPDSVKRVVAGATPGEILPSASVIDLLRLPLLLSIYVLSEARSTTTGDLLRQFHEHLMRGLPERFTEVLAEAVAELSLAKTRSFGRLVHELQARAAKAGLAEPISLLKRLGTILERGGQSIPVHDLYWSWLAGRGLLKEAAANRAIGALATRESYALAIQAGGFATENDVNATARNDIVLAAILDASRSASHPTQSLADALSDTLADPRLAVRSRGALAALEGERPEFLHSALEVLAALGQAQIYPDDWKYVLHPIALYSQRATLANWLGSPNSNLVLDAIARSGGPEWSHWLEQVAQTGRISWAEAAATALGCCSDIPSWVRPHIDTVISSCAWTLRPAAERRGNAALARFIAVEYERLIDFVITQNSSAWIEVNRVLVDCGNDEVFGLLLVKFPDMGARAQELLGYAVVNRGAPWIARYQRIALSTGAPHHHKLADQLSLEIDDATARTWITSGHADAGWRVLITRHGEALLPELIEQLPSSFAGLDHIPALAHMRWLTNAPESLIGEIWGRLGSPMQPKAMQDVLGATARVYPQGIAHIVNFIANQPGALPAYHLRQTVLLYEDWRKQCGLGLGVKLIDGSEYSFVDWIAIQVGLTHWEDHFSPEILALSPEFTANYIIPHLNDTRTAAVLQAFRGTAPYSATLLDRAFSSSELIKLIPRAFANSFDLFPVEALQRCIESSDIDQDSLLYHLATSANPLHRVVHEELIRRILGKPLKLHDLRYVAEMLRAYSREEVLNIIDSAPMRSEDHWLWFVRSVEIARGERLINEDGAIRQ